jgi:hypothetical protein
MVIAFKDGYITQVEGGGNVFGMVVGLYVMLGAVALIFAAGWIPILVTIPFSLPGISVPGPAAWAIQIGHTFANVLAQQPLLQALVGAMVAGWICAQRVRHVGREHRTSGKGSGLGQEIAEVSVVFGTVLKQAVCQAAARQERGKAESLN